MVFVFGKFTPQVKFKACLHPVTELEAATGAAVLIDRYNPNGIMAASDYPALKEEFLRYRSDGFELVNWHVAMVREEHFKGTDRWEDTACYAVV
jgi:hypothetical protein